YDLVAFFIKWALRISRTEADRNNLVPSLLVAICPDEEYAAWAESEDRVAERNRQYKRFKGTLHPRKNVKPGLCGLWETTVQRCWVVAKGRMAKYEPCPHCLEYDSHEELSPATRALRVLGNVQPVQEDLKRQLYAAFEHPVYDPTALEASEMPAGLKSGE